MSRGTERIPDFRLPIWNLAKQTPSFIENPQRPDRRIRVCHYNMFVNCLTGDTGHEIVIAGYSTPAFTCWEDGKIQRGKRTILYYIGHYRSSRWRIFQVKSNFGTYAVEFDRAQKPMNITAAFELISGRLKEFPFPYLIV